LADLLSCKNDDVLADIGKAMLTFKDDALPYLVKALASENWSTRRGASLVLGKLGPGSLNKLMSMVPENEEDVDYWMVQTLGNMGGEAVQYLERIVDEMTEEQAALCAEGQSITELVAAKDKLIEQMREALEKCRDTFASYVLDHSGKLHITPIAPIDLCAPIREKIAKNQRMVDLCDAALAAERGE